MPIPTIRRVSPIRACCCKRRPASSSIFTKSWLVGDKAIDVEAAKRAGIAGALQVATGYGNAERQLGAAFATAKFEVRFGQSIADAMTLPILLPQNVG